VNNIPNHAHTSKERLNKTRWTVTHHSSDALRCRHWWWSATFWCCAHLRYTHWRTTHWRSTHRCTSFCSGICDRCESRSKHHCRHLAEHWWHIGGLLFCKHWCSLRRWGQHSIALELGWRSCHFCHAASTHHACHGRHGLHAWVYASLRCRCRCVSQGSCLQFGHWRWCCCSWCLCTTSFWHWSSHLHLWVKSKSKPWYGSSHKAAHARWHHAWRKTPCTWHHAWRCE